MKFLQIKIPYSTSNEYGDWNISVYEYEGDILSPKFGWKTLLYTNTADELKIVEFIRMALAERMKDRNSKVPSKTWTPDETKKFNRWSPDEDPYSDVYGASKAKKLEREDP